MPLSVASDDQLKVSIYPNPASDILNLCTDIKEPLSYNITDYMGRVAATGNFQGNQSLSISFLPRGLYLFHAKNAEGYELKKVLVLQ